MTINITDALDSLTLEDIDKYQFTRKVNPEEALLNAQMYKAKFDRINKEINEEFSEKFE